MSARDPLADGTPPSFPRAKATSSKLRPRDIAIGLLVVAAIALVALWWNATYVRVERRITLPPRGEASYNPLYALKLALRADGRKAESRQRLRYDEIALGARDTLLLLGDPRTLSQHEVDGLLDWVDGGGHLLVRTPPAQLGEGDRDPQQLLAQLSVAVLPGKETCLPYARVDPRADAETDGDDAATSRKATRRRYLFCGSARFTMDGVEPLASWGDLDDGYGYARIGYGDGTVDVLADFDFLTNAELEEARNITLARQLLQPGWNAGTVHLVYAASMPPLWRLLLAKAWMAWIPLALAVAAWLWMRMQRFGPLRPAQEEGRRALLEHVQMSGEHLWRYGRGAVLYDAMRAYFLSRLRRRDPLAAALTGPAQHHAIAARTGASVDEVAQALQSPRPNDGADFRLRIARLIQLRQRL